MPDPNAKTPGNLVRVCRRNGETATLECDWVLVRFEPESGNAVAERAGKRIVCPRDEFEKLNFPGSDELWKVLCGSSNGEGLKGAREIWAKGDLQGLVGALLRHARSLDPAFGGVQTIDDLVQKTGEIEDTCFRAMDLLRLETNRAEKEYNRCPSRTAFECDQKDSLLARWRDLENQYATKKYRYEQLLPAWQRLVAALRGLDAAVKRIGETSP